MHNVPKHKEAILYQITNASGGLKKSMLVLPVPADCGIMHLRADARCITQAYQAVSAMLVIDNQTV